MPKGNTKENGTNNLKIKRVIQRFLGASMTSAGAGTNGETFRFSGARSGVKCLRSACAGRMVRILSVSWRGRDKGRSGGRCPCVDCRMGAVRKRRRTIIAERRNTQGPAKRDGEGGTTSFGSSADRAAGEGGADEPNRRRTPVRLRSLGCPCPADVRRAHLLRFSSADRYRK